MLNNFQVSKNFNLREFECHCCHAVKLDLNLVEDLQKLRNILGHPIRITSGYRCPAHNKIVGGVENSQHLVGKAADIVIVGCDITPQQLAQIAAETGFDGIGVYKNFVHVDVRGKKARWSQ